MADPRRWIIVKFFQHAIERTEAEIEELKAGRLFVRDASGPDDRHEPAPSPAPAAAAPAPPLPATPPPPGTPPAGPKPDAKTA